jgi:hypothetical protein
MEYRAFGKTGIQISAIGIGCWEIGGGYGSIEETEFIKAVNRALDVVRDLALRRLFALRADAAALRVATEVWRGLSGAAWREAHRDALSQATGAAWEGVRASRDGDAPRLAAAVGGAGAGEKLRLALRERFDEDWWRNPRTGAHLAGLLAAGALPPSEAPPPAADAARMLASRLERVGG